MYAAGSTAFSEIRNSGEPQALRDAFRAGRSVSLNTVSTHLRARDHGVMDPAPAPYLIRIDGHLGATVLSAFPELAPRHHGGHTVLTGLLNRSALYGVLAEIKAPRLGLLELRKLTPDRKSPEPGDTRSP
jgi:hypothetical protein